jgi:hypothetical protein
MGQAASILPKTVTELISSETEQIKLDLFALRDCADSQLRGEFKRSLRKHHAVWTGTWRRVAGPKRESLYLLALVTNAAWNIETPRLRYSALPPDGFVPEQ